MKPNRFSAFSRASLADITKASPDRLPGMQSRDIDILYACQRAAVAT
jgi:hypothetical protein